MRQRVEAEQMTDTGLCENGLTKILAEVVEEVRLSIDKDINGTDLLHSLLSAPWLKSLLRVYECLLEYRRISPSPYLTYASALTQEIMGDMRSLPNPSAEAQELYMLLKAPHCQALLSAHDSVAQKNYGPVLPQLPDDLPEDEEAMRIVCLVKNKQPLGATIKKDEKTGEIFIARVIHGGLADRSGLLYPGDKLVEVNGEPVEGLEPVQVIHILVHSQGTILFKLIPNSPQPAISQSIMFVRAMVDYNPLQDPSIPCADAGMAFSKGDLLEIVDQKDIQWWQAKQMPNATACAGLIPSISHFRSKKREFWWSQPYQAHTCIKPLSAADVGEKDGETIEENCLEADDEDLETEDGEHGGHIEDFYIAGFRNSLRLWRRKALIKRRQSCHSCSSNSCASASPYEEVINYQRNANEAPRLIILTGPSGVGINEIRRRLVKFNPNTFQAPIPYTTRPPRGTELNGREYHFITKELFEYLVVNHKFIEYGEHKGHLYGTCYDSIKDVLDSGKTCIIDLDPHCIPAARTKILKPYIIFVKPPSVKRMKLTRRDAKFIAGSYFKRTFRDEDFEEIEEAGKLMKAQYSQFFDCVIVNDRLQDACRDLFAAIRHAQEEPQWIPASWISLDEP
ncbi:MAGUK p55 subfamily member 4 isoform X1 [Astyanax mexicanus]|uniref:MAGUK p55 subfamily member 4 isoform X1 n=1 Tax=Astyanax mexicanus TaxID=7994 RepID=UPI0020CB61BE|nr:MAGUK p55 subfamily member 4 isoform X1 [Astyanax mexicanus]XP_049340555.1 MAGUK p55 subfamily member 4 isoform X1 [Astyanax mexicanus]